MAEWRDGFFVLDKWQVTRKLTLNYGIRYELPTVPYTINGNASDLNPDQTALDRGHARARTSSSPSTRTGRRASASPTASTTRRPFRGGAGIYYNPNQTNSYTFLNTNPPLTTILSCNWSSGLPTLSLSNPFAVPGACPVPGGRSAELVVTPPCDQPTPRMNQWSASLERQFWNGGGLEVQYLGSHSYHLDRSFYNNTPLPGPGAVNTRRPNQNFGGPIRTIANDEIANYESMSVIFRQRCTRGFTGQVELHVVAHPGCHYRLQRRRHSDESLQLEGRLRQFQLGHPAPRGRHLRLRHPVLRQRECGAEGRVRRSGRRTASSPSAADSRSTSRTGTDTANTASSGTYRPNLVKTPTANCGRGHLVGCIDPTAFTIADLYPANPTNYAYGNAGRNLLHGPGAEEVNFSLFKNFPISERLRFQFRFETFNLFNHANFGNPSATINTSSFGNITGLAAGTNNRQIQVGAKLAF